MDSNAWPNATRVITLMKGIIVSNATQRASNALVL
jgi:hypothetical protein